MITPAMIENARNETGLKINLWEKGNKCRIYVDGCGYITEDSDDVYGNSNGDLDGFWYQYNRPGKAGRLRDAIKAMNAVIA
jgi:hypothetical protein